MFNGVRHHQVRVNPFVTTLGSMTIIRGIVLLVHAGRRRSRVPFDSSPLGQGKIAGIFYPFIIMIAFLLIADVLLRKFEIPAPDLFTSAGTKKRPKLSGIT